MDSVPERHVVDLEEVGDYCLNFLERVLYHNPNKNQFIVHAYNEILAQVLLCITHERQESELRLIALPDIKMFSHIPELVDPNIYNDFNIVMKHIGTRLMTILEVNCNPMKLPCSYFFDSASRTYLILIKQ